MSQSAIANALTPIFAANGLAVSPEVLKEVVKAAALKAHGEALRRFLAQFELLSGGPLEVGEEAYARVLDIAFQNVFEAIALVDKEFNLSIGLGPFIIEAQDPLELSSSVYYHPCFGWAEGARYAYGYDSEEAATDALENLVEKVRCPKVVRFVQG